MFLRVLSALLLLSAGADAVDIRGTVVNAQGGEALVNVRVVLSDTLTTTTGENGEFSFAAVPVGEYTLRVEAIGFWLQRTPIQVTASSSNVLDFAIALVPEGARHEEKVEVRADRFTGPDTAQPAAFTLTGPELRDSSTVLAADPFRSIQAMPGVTAANNNDFFAQFTVRGAAFDKVAVYLDGIQLRQPFHGIQSVQDGASVSLLSPDTLESLTLTPTAFSERYGDGTGGSLDLGTREGSASRRPIIRVSAGIAESHFSAEGALLGKLGSWLVAGRKSYMGYLLRHNSIDPTIDVSFYDFSAKATLQAARNHTFDLYAMSGHATLHLNSRQSLNQLSDGDNTFTFARAGWRWSAAPTLLVSSNLAFIRHRYGTRNYNGDGASRDYYGEWVGSTVAVWSWKKDHVLETGYTARRLRELSGSVLFYPAQVPYDDANGTALRQGGYVQQSSSFLGKRLELMAGLRWDRISVAQADPVSPQATASFRLLRSTSLQVGWGRYFQFADMTHLAAPCHVGDFEGQVYSDSYAPASRAQHFSAGIEQRLGESSRLRIEFYDRTETPWYYYRPPQGGECGPQFVKAPPLGYKLGDQRARGVEITFQRRSANRLSGWLSYTYGRAREYFPVDTLYTGQDQRHTLNIFGVYRLMPTVNISGKWLYGSGYPVETYYDPNNLTSPANQLRLGPYERLDLRADKLLNIHRRKVTLYGEVINLTNHRNMRVTGLGNYDPVTQRFPLLLQRAAGFIPAAGVSIEF
jgi:hypothetical protein